MRDQRFIAEHRGGPLTKEEHALLIQWACDCAKHVLRWYTGQDPKQLKKALATAKAWQEGKATVGDARNASLDTITLAKELTDPVDIAIARCVGHAVATAHMADHCLRAAQYALKAVKASGKSVDTEKQWQQKQLPAGVKELVISAVYHA